LLGEGASFFSGAGCPKGAALAEQIFDLRPCGLLRRSGLSGGGLDAKRTISAEQVDRLVTKALPCDQISDVRFAVGFSHASTLRNILPELWPLQNRISPPRADSQV